jgi:hypothetical protein
MEPTQLQLALNVVTITGVASLAGYCYLLKKENRKLAAHSACSHCDAPKAEVVQAVVQLQSTPPSAVKEDIRNFAAGRRSRWVKNLSSAISQR